MPVALFGFGFFTIVLQRRFNVPNNYGGDSRGSYGYGSGGGGGYGDSRRDSRGDGRGYDSRGGYDSRDSRGDSRGGGRGRGGRGQRERRGIPLSELDPALTAISHKVIGAATEVHVDLGPGFDRQVYMNALQGELAALGIPFVTGHTFNVKFKDRVIGSITSDLFVDGKFLVSIAADPRDVGPGERSALRAQLKAADLILGLVINFGGRRLKDGLVRVINIDKLRLERGDLFDDEGDEHEGGHEGGHDEHHDSAHGGGGQTYDYDQQR